MSSHSKTLRSHDLHKWRYEEDIRFIKSLVGSELEFSEGVNKTQRVVGTLHKCEENAFTLNEAKINGQFFGDYVINVWEFKKWRIISYKRPDNPSKSRLPNRPNSRRSDDNSRYVIPNRDEELVGGDPDEDLLRQYVEPPLYSDDVEVIDLNEDEDEVQINVQPLTLKASNEMIFFDKINEDFDVIVQKLEECDFVGFALFGDEISRDGVIELMSFATRNAIYVFDANNRELISRLKPILESEDVLKLMYGLRHSSDALYHLFRIELNNAIDIKVWDYCLQKKNFISSQIYSKPVLRSLETILWLYLRVKLPNMSRHLDYGQFSVKLQNHIRLKTIFLRELYHLINYKLNESANQMNSRCLRSLRSSEGLEYMAVKDDEMELEIIDNPNVESEEIERKIISLASNKPINGFKGKEIIVTSNDEIVINSDEEIDEIMVRLTPK